MVSPTHYSTMGLHNFAGVDARRRDDNIIHGSCFPMQAHHARTPVPFSLKGKKNINTTPLLYIHKYLYHILHFFAIRRRDDDEHGTHTTFSSPLSHPKNKKLATTLFTHSAFINTSAYTPPSHPRLGRNPSRCRRCRRPPPPSSPGRPACAPPPAGTAPRNYPSRRCTYPALSKS